MKFKRINFLVLVLVGIFCTFSHAYEQKGCMQGLDATLNTVSALEEASKNMSSTMFAILSSGATTDTDTVNFLSDSASRASMGLNSAQVISTLRQYGSFKQPTLIDNLVKNEFQVTYEKFRQAKDTYMKFTGSLKNPILREQAFTVSQELEKITTQIRSCQK